MNFYVTQVYIGMESTTHYIENLTYFLFTRGFKVCKSNIRKTKTNYVDTYLIIKAFLRINHFRDWFSQ